MALLKFLIFLIAACYWAIFCIYNTGAIPIMLPGFKQISISASLFVLLVFLSGVCITALFSLVDQLHQWISIRELKKRLREQEHSRVADPSSEETE